MVSRIIGLIITLALPLTAFSQGREQASTYEPTSLVGGKVSMAQGSLTLGKPYTLTQCSSGYEPGEWRYPNDRTYGALCLELLLAQTIITKGSHALGVNISAGIHSASREYYASGWQKSRRFLRLAWSAGIAYTVRPIETFQIQLYGGLSNQSVSMRQYTKYMPDPELGVIFLLGDSDKKWYGVTVDYSWYSNYTPDSAYDHITGISVWQIGLVFSKSPK